MLSLSICAAAFVLVAGVGAQSPVYGQCGGTGYTGPTTCIAGSVCTYSNPYYSQCLPSSGGTTTTSMATITTTKGSTTAHTTTTSLPSGTSGAVLTTQWQCETENAGYYTLCLNLWGESGASSGSQTAQMTGSSGNSISWVTNWNWNGGTGVKSYTNVGLQKNVPKQLSAISSVPSVWDWSYPTQSNVKADVAYDIWFAASATGSSTYEIMIWLGESAGIAPIGSPIATVTIAGYSWTLWKGTNSTWTVFSFVRGGSSDITAFSGDLNAFFKYLTTSQGVSSSQFLTAVQAGTEPTTGSAQLKTTNYSVVVN